MEKISNWLDKRIVPIAAVLNSNRFISAIRDGFIATFPITMPASIVALINNVLLDPDSMIAQVLFLPKLFPHLKDAQQVFSAVGNGTLSLMSIFVTFLIAYNLSKHNRSDNPVTAGLIAIVSFMILYPKPEWLKGISEGNYITTDYLGAKGLFLAMIVACLIGEFFPKLCRNKRLVITLPEQVPPAVAQSFSALIPVTLVILFTSVLAFLSFLYKEQGINEVVYNWIQTPIRNMGSNLVGVYVLTLLLGLFWFMGIHGSATLNPIIAAIFTEMDLTNSQHVLAGKPLSELPYPATYGLLSATYGYMGGAGMTLGLIIAILIVTKRKDYREVAKMSLVPGIFNINEPIIFGLPIILNPFLAIPFIFTPVISLTLAYFATIVFKIVPPAGIGVAWTVPGPLQTFLGTGGSIAGLLLGLVCLGVSVIVYIPFLKAADAYARREKNLK
ncbi:PTS system, cellobiose-specific IIC component [Enterococcus sp. AZ194]|uniref:PTS sugar transporter subunit IIC n=1 Tax=Enterococcus sp. AZ194 TaxID=2774629 RepID=UPI003F202939